MAIKVVGVLGCGLMGGGIAQVSAASGYKTVVREMNQTALDKGMGRIRKFLEDGIAKGKVTSNKSKAAPKAKTEVKKNGNGEAEAVNGIINL